MFNLDTRFELGRLRVLCAAALALSLLAVPGHAQERDRAKIADKYKWDLSDLYPNDAAWRAAKEKVAAAIPGIEAFKGKLAGSASVVADALETMSGLDKDLSRLYSYAMLLADQDTRDAQHEGMKQEILQLYSRFAAAASYIEPEIVRFPKGTIEKLVMAEQRLRVYEFYLKDIERRAAHTLSEPEEKLLADVLLLADSPSSTYGIIANADLPYPTVTLSDGKTVKLDQAAYNDLRALPNRADREKVMSSFFNTLGSFSRTFGTTINGEVQKVAFVYKARKYPSAVAWALDAANIPTTVYSRLVDGVNKNLPVFHRYLNLRKRMMGVDQLHYYDLYAPLVSSVNLEYSPEQAQEHVLAAVAPLGEDYQGVVKRAFGERWIDLFPNEGKRSGAYSMGDAYDVHPYMLINYNGKYTDVSTLAHELGHAMQSYYSNKTQPYPLADYPIFVAEVASTFNESLLIDYMLDSDGIKNDDNARLSLLGNYLENIKGTVFRQAQFAEFELRMHEMAQAGQPITGDALAKLYMDITKKYYGHDQGVTVVDDYIAHEWSFIPHFYRDFYVYQYATSFTASMALAEKVKAGDADARRRYLAFLSAGGSKYPIDLLKDAGVDMTTDEPLDLTLKAMTRVMDEMEALLAKRK
jgi:oligoendopeptidase F